MVSFRSHTNGTVGRGLGHIISAPFTSASASLANARKRMAIPMTTFMLSSAFLMGGVVAGVIISTHWQVGTASPPSASASAPITRQSDQGIVAATISRLESEQARLKNQIADMRTQLSAVQASDTQHKSTLSNINNEVARQRLAAGMVALHGPGVTVTLDDSTVRSIPENEDPANYILHDYDLRDVLNALWIAGAEAISVNGERIVSNTSLYCVGTTVICNTTRLSPPYEIQAVGESQALEASLRGSSQMEKLNQRAQVYDLPIKIDQSQDVLVPAYNGSFVFKYAKVNVQ